MEKKKYTRDQKREWYKEQIMYLEYRLKSMKRRLAYIESDQYQDWDSDLARELSQKIKSS